MAVETDYIFPLVCFDLSPFSTSEDKLGGHILK